MSVEIKNKKARFTYTLLDEFTAGLELTGTEIKSIRAGEASIAEAYCRFVKNELYVINMNVAVYEQGGIYNHEPKRERRLLLKKQELGKIKKKMKDVGLTIIPTLLFISDRGYAKLNIAIAKGKKLYDKRQDLKAKDQQRDIDRVG